MLQRFVILATILGLAATAAMAAGNADTEKVTFSNQVVRIFQEKCQTCHRPGDIAPMSLLSYDEARPWAKSIRKVVSERTMPPWHIAAEPGIFRNDKSLSQNEIDTLVAWISAGAPEGNPADLPPPKTFEQGGFKLAEPDLVYSMPESFVVGKDLLDEYRCFVIPTAFAQDLWYRGSEYRPGNPAVVHHVIAFADTSGSARERDAADPQPGYECGMASGVGAGVTMLGGWAPGNDGALAPPGMGSKIPQGADVVYQVHYHNTSGIEQQDRSSMAIYLQRGTITKVPRTVPIGQWVLDIKAGDPASVHTATWTAPANVHVRAVMPHMHYIGKRLTLEATYPDGAKETLIDVPRYDFNWQTSYIYNEPRAIPKGTVLTMTSWHDNSAENPNQQFDPPRDVHFGEATHEEMAIAWTSITFDDQVESIEPVIPEELIAQNRAERSAGVQGAVKGATGGQ